MASIGCRIYQEDLRSAWVDLREDIGSRLECGDLVGKGVPAPYTAGKDEVRIAPHEWRILEIDPISEAAVERGPGGARYVGVVIGRKG